MYELTQTWQRKFPETIKPEQVPQESSHVRMARDLASSVDAQLELQMLPSTLPFSVTWEWKAEYILRVKS